MENEAGRFTLIFLGVPGDEGGEVELTHNWDESGYGGGRNFGHLAYRGRRHLRDLPAADGRWRDDQPPAARRPHGVRPLARQHLGRAAAEGRRAGAGRALGIDAQHGRMVMGCLRVVAVPAFSDNYVWLVHDADSGETAAVDPGVAAPVLAEAERARLAHRRRCWNTHWHPDHTGGNVAIKEATGARDLGPGGRGHPGPRRRAGRRRRRCASAVIDGRVIEVPAHTLGHIALIFEDERHDLRRRHDVRHGLRPAVRGHAEQMYATCSGSRRCPTTSGSIARHEYTLGERAVRGARRARQCGDRASGSTEVRALREAGQITLADHGRGGTRHQSLRSGFGRGRVRASLRKDKDSFRS